MAITVNTAWAQGEKAAGGGPTLTIANTVVASGSNTIMLVGFLAYDGTNSTNTYTVSRNGQSFTQATINGPGGTTPDNDQIAWFYRKAPDVGSYSLTITSSAGLPFITAAYVVLDGVDQSTTVRTATKANGSVAQNSTYTITASNTQIDDYVVGVWGAYVGATYTLTTDQTEVAKDLNNSANDSLYVNATTAAGSSTALNIKTSGYGGTTGTYWGAVVPVIAASAASTPTISGIVPTVLSDGLVGIVITGTNFGASQGAGTVKISPTDNVADGGAISQTVTAWADTSITITASRSTLSQNANLYAFVTNNGGSSNSSGSIVQFGVLRSTRLYGVQGSLKTIVTL